jgi:hypothetical protein
MTISRNKTTATTIAIFLMLTITATLVALPIANAHTPPWTNIPTWAYVSANPNPVGVYQTVTIVFWLDKVPPTAAGIGGDRWRNLAIEVTKPDGSKETLGPFVSDPVGGSYTLYTPDQVGTYSFVFSFPGQVLSRYGPTGIVGSTTNVYENDTYLASSATTTLTVQQEPIDKMPGYPLPTEYWTRPIEGQNTEWYQVASHWLAGSQIDGKFQMDGIAPNSAHIMWTKPLQFGGVVGGTRTGLNGMTFHDGTAYESKMRPIIIMQGRLYYDLPRSDSPTGNGYVCVDLRTGEEIYWQNMTVPSFGQLYDYESQNQHGVIENGYLWSTVGTAWNAYDPLDGGWLFTLTDVPSGTAAYGPNGEILRYVLNTAGKWLALWNNTAEQQGLHAALGTSTTAYQWRPIGKTVNMSKAYSWNVTIPSLMTGATVVKVIPDDILLGRNGSLPSLTVQTPYTMWAISLKPTSRGQLLWMKNYDAPGDNSSLSFKGADPVTRVFVMWDKETLTFTGYSIDNGTLMWTTQSKNPWDFYLSMDWTDCQFAYGKLYAAGYSGILSCYDLNTGRVLWNYSTYSGFETPYPGAPLAIMAVADGKVYMLTTEHSANQPHWLDIRIRCVNASTGKEVWTVDGYGNQDSMAVADGYLVYLNLYDTQIYCVGKGPSATTVTASPKVAVNGDSVLVEGMVIDTAAGTKQKEQAARFPNGVPAVSDASMSAWMEYVYMQKPRPTNATGVEVTLDAVDPNGNWIHIGTATSDTSGSFSYMWTPEVPGKYTVIATFAGSESYWPSYAETAIGVSEASPATPPPPAAAPLPPFDMYIIAATIAIIIAVAIVGLMILRRKP